MKDRIVYLTKTELSKYRKKLKRKKSSKRAMDDNDNSNTSEDLSSYHIRFTKSSVTEEIEQTFKKMDGNIWKKFDEVKPKNLVKLYGVASAKIDGVKVK